jgi:hypothetical protein
MIDQKAPACFAKKRRICIFEVPGGYRFGGCGGFETLSGSEPSYVPGGTMVKVAIAVCFASLAFGQNVDRVFRLMNATAVTSLQEIATTLRTVAQIQQLSVDNALATLTVKGTADQISLAEWLVPKLDVTADSNPGPQEYRVPGDSDDVVVVFELVHAATNQSVQEIATTLRTVADIQKIFAITTPKIVTLRGSASQMALAEFLLAELDQPALARQNAFVHEFRKTAGINDIVVVYGLTHTNSSQSLQEIITNVRVVLDIQRIFQVTAPKLLAARGSESQVQTLKWLVPGLDRQTPKVGGNEVRVPGGNDDVVHVFYLTHVTNVKGMNDLLTELRTTVHIMKAFVRSVPAALVLRGTADQIATAGQIIELRDHATL